jgi:hypothetical protein
LRDDLAEREYSNPTTLDVERLRVLQDKSYNPSSRAVPVDSDMDPQSLKNIQMNEDLKKLQIKSKVLSRSSTPDILNDLLQEYMTDSGPPKPQTTKLTTKQSAPRFFLLDDPTVQQGSSTLHNSSIGELRRGSLNKAHQLSTEADNQTLQHKDYHNSHKGDQDHQEGSDFIFDEDSVDPNALL